MKLVILGSALLGLLLTGCGKENQSSQLNEAPDYQNQPSRMGIGYTKLTDVWESGSISTEAWSGNYWPTYKGGIAHRWQTDNFGTNYWDYLYQPFNFSEAQRLSEWQINQLSPSEKYDLWMGDTNFGLTRSEQANTRSHGPSLQTWFGLCHGWAPASIMEPQARKTVTVRTPNGTPINFYPSDIKALITKVYADSQLQTTMIGGRCNSTRIQRDRQGRPTDPSCRDVNPATLHLVLNDYITNKNKSFLMDVTGGSQVWNQPVVGYSFRYYNERPFNPWEYSHAAPGTALLVEVDTTIQYVAEVGPSRYGSSPAKKSMVVSYTLELASDYTVLGGEWRSEARPDFLWSVNTYPSYYRNGSLSYQNVKELLNYSR